jgi:hypothetical protein
VKLLALQYHDLFQNTTTAPFITVERYWNISKCVSAINPDLLMTGNASVLPIIDQVDQMIDFEKQMYVRAWHIFLDSYSAIVLDDELIGTRSKSVKSKALSNQKAGKEGIKNDAIADTVLHAIFSVAHKQHLNYNQQMTVMNLVDQIYDPLSSGAHNVIWAAD